MNVKEVGRSMGFQLKEVVSGEKPILAISEGAVLMLGIKTVTVIILYAN